MFTYRQSIVRSLGVHRYLHGIQYPAKKEEIIEFAILNEMPIDIVDSIREIPGGTYLGVADLLQEIEEREQSILELSAA